MKHEYTLPEVASILGVSHVTVWTWAKAKRIKTRKRGIMPQSPRVISQKELNRLKREMGIR